ncbi:hypothetical protein DFJ74DRAFT_677900 [Hyaloraphidium curvatum]|nr:hypothetical protein DFJ74DRAFT_677900 [Hyaloraphidium curvatum]
MPLLRHLDSLTTFHSLDLHCWYDSSNRRTESETWPTVIRRFPRICAKLFDVSVDSDDLHDWALGTFHGVTNVLVPLIEPEDLWIVQKSFPHAKYLKRRGLPTSSLPGLKWDELYFVTWNDCHFNLESAGLRELASLTRSQRHARLCGWSPTGAR